MKRGESSDAGPRVRVLSWSGRWGRALDAAVSKPFTAATGIAVEAVPHVGLRLPEDLTMALTEQRASPVDVVWCNSAPALRAAARGHCTPLEGLPVLEQLRDRARPQGFADWPLVQAYVVHYVLVYRRALYPHVPPRSWQVLADPRHRGRVVLYPGGKGFFPVAQILGGGEVDGIPEHMEPCWSVVRALRGQLGRPDYSIGLAAPLRSGTIDLCYRALPNALGFQEDDGLQVAWTVPEEGAADTSDALWIPRSLSDEAERQARQYVAFALSAPVQQRWCALLGALPVHPGAAIPALFAAHPTLPIHAGDPRVLHVPEPLEARCEPEWQATFDSLTRGPLGGTRR